MTAWTWRYETADGTAVEPATDASMTAVAQSFPNQSDAETWIGEIWQDLLDEGIDAVTLFEDDRLVYGPMSLHPPT
ncbi:MAG: hypothetical protein WCI29_04485 [Actinomycetes bacterium]|jgi:hypothetical protein